MKMREKDWNKAELAGYQGVSRAWVMKVMRELK